MSDVTFKAPLSELDDHLSEADFDRVARLVGEKTGIKMPPAKHMLAEGRLRKRMRAKGFATLSEYCDWLFDCDGLSWELQHLIDVVTTNKTDFFREPDHYVHLERMIVPELLQLRRERLPLIKIWSAACSNGAEAYTAAMVLQDMLRSGDSFRYAILGTDISTSVLEQGQRAIYTAEWMEPVPHLMQSRYVMRSRKQQSRPEVRIVPELRRKVKFRHLNLMDKSYPVDHEVDVIFLRNVLIYFERAVQEKVTSKLIGHLRSGGYLLLGHSESMIGAGQPVTQVAPSVFRKN